MSLIFSSVFFKIIRLSLVFPCISLRNLKLLLKVSLGIYDSCLVRQLTAVVQIRKLSHCCVKESDLEISLKLSVLL